MKALDQIHLRIAEGEFVSIVGASGCGKSLDLDRWSWSIYSPLPGSVLSDKRIAEGKIEPYRLDHQRVNFTKAYAGICDITFARLEQLCQEINEYFCNMSISRPLAQAG